jgi:hypothetical protein
VQALTAADAHVLLEAVAGERVEALVIVALGISGYVKGKRSPFVGRR